MRVRFAPSPTGPLHIGGIRTALYNYLLAKQQGGTFILRIEDTDQTRYVPGAEEYIIQALNWCGLSPDEGPGVGGEYGPYRQSERGALYRAAVDRLIATGKAYYAFDSPEKLDELRQEAEARGSVFRYDASTRTGLDNSLSLDAEKLNARLAAGEAAVVRLLVNPDERVVFEDRIRGEVSFDAAELDDKVLLKADGMPTYHLANVVDDEHMGISHVIRGEEWLPSTAHHVLLYRAFGWEEKMPVFAHLPLILKPEGKGKLSKRDGAKFGIPVFPLAWNAQGEEPYAGFRESGFLAEAVVNFLALLGWNPGTEQEIFSLDELISAFDLDRIGKSGARFDFNKARWFNQQYIARLSDEGVAEKALPIGLEHYKGRRTDLISPDYFLKLAPLMRERVQQMEDLFKEHSYLFDAPETYDDAQAQKRLSQLDQAGRSAVRSHLEAASPWNSDQLNEELKVKSGLKPGVIMPLLRIALTGGMSGPDVVELSVLLGQEEVLRRWDKFMAVVS